MPLLFGPSQTLINSYGLAMFGIESFDCPCQVVDVPQIEYEDKVVEVPVQKHVQVGVKLPAGSLSVREGNAPLEA